MPNGDVDSSTSIATSLARSIYSKAGQIERDQLRAELARVRELAAHISSLDDADGMADRAKEIERLANAALTPEGA